MKTLGTLGLAILWLLMTGSLATYSQDRDNSRSGQAQEEKDTTKNNDKDKQKDHSVKQEQKQGQDQRDTKQEQRHDKDSARQEQKQEKQEQKEQRSDRGMESEQHRHSAAAKQGKRIPDDRFRAHFGRQHTFRVQRTQVVNVAQPVIVYGGYSFQLVEVWPVDWGFDDDCYIDYVDGQYFLFDAFHPSIRIAVFVVG